MHQKATTAFWHPEGIVSEKAKDRTDIDADENHLLLGQALAAELA